MSENVSGKNTYMDMKFQITIFHKIKSCRSGGKVSFVVIIKNSAVSILFFALLDIFHDCNHDVNISSSMNDNSEFWKSTIGVNKIQVHN